MNMNMNELVWEDKLHSSEALGKKKKNNKPETQFVRRIQVSWQWIIQIPGFTVKVRHAVLWELIAAWWHATPPSKVERCCTQAAEHWECATSCCEQITDNKYQKLATQNATSILYSKTIHPCWRASYKEKRMTQIKLLLPSVVFTCRQYHSKHPCVHHLQCHTCNCPSLPLNIPLSPILTDSALKLVQSPRRSVCLTHQEPEGKGLAAES